MTSVSGEPFARPEDADHRQAWWGVHYVGSICAQAGYQFTETPPQGDVHSLDGYVFMRPGLSVSVQVKCTHKPLARQRSWHIKSAWRKNWEALDTPGYFVQVSVPSDTTSWVEHPAEPRWTTLHKSAAFWTRIDPLTPGQSSITVKASQRLTVDTLDVWAADLETVVRGFSGGGAP